MMRILPTLRKPYEVALNPAHVAAVQPEGLKESKVLLASGREYHVTLPFYTTLGRLYGDYHAKEAATQNPRNSDDECTLNGEGSQSSCS